MQKKYQVFVSSTFRDLINERQDAIRNILDLGHIPAGMELFPAADTEQLTYIKKVIDECDYYVLIMGGRYGSLDDEGVSFTEREYQYALDTGKVVLAFIHGKPDEIPVGKTDIGEELALRLATFRNHVMTGRLVKPWTSRDDLQIAVIKGLMNAFNTQPAVGWVRADTVASEDILSQINQLRLQNEQLVNEKSLADHNARAPNIINLASLDDVFRIRYSWYDGNPYMGNGTTRNEAIDLTWANIFVAVGAQLIAPSPRAVIKEALQNSLSENRGLPSGFTVYDSDIQSIENQLCALGLVQVTVHEGEGRNQYTALGMVTDSGRLELMRLMAVRVT